MKDLIIGLLVLVAVFLMWSRQTSGAEQLNPSSASCAKNMIPVSRKCSDFWPETYNKDGKVVGDKKYCCQ